MRVLMLGVLTLFLTPLGCGPAKVWQPCMNTSCSLCGGTGTYKCDACEGTGQLGKCTTCTQSPGKSKCEECFRGKLVDGIPCGNFFHNSYPKNGAECPRCNGSGFDYPPGSPCPTCEGSTWRSCTTCGGDGSIGCDKCKESGERKHGKWEFAPE